MESVILDNIPFEPDIETLAEWLHFKPGTPQAGSVMALAEETQALARPKAMYRLAYIDSKGDDFVEIAGVRLKSKVLRKNVGEAHRVFAYCATCGLEIDDWAHSQEGALDRFYADALCHLALSAAREALRGHIDSRYKPGSVAEMNPGSLPDWPLREQRPLFQILGDPEAAIGVQLMPSFLMKPVKTVSGLIFPNKSGYYNCQLCPMEDCPGRRAPLDLSLVEEYGTQPAAKHAAHPHFQH